MDALKRAILTGFRGGVDSHGFTTNDADDIYNFMVAHGIHNGDEARREYCASLRFDVSKCPHLHLPFSA